MQSETKQKCAIVVKNRSGRFSGRFLGRIGYILGVSGDFPYLRRCELAGPKREPSKLSLWEKLTANIDNNTPPLIKFAVGGGGRSKTIIGSAIVAMAAAIVTIANVVMVAAVEPQQSWS